jgi:phosphatidylglycerophosphate synthase
MRRDQGQESDLQDQIMLDRHLRPLIDPPLNRIGFGLAAQGVSANAVTLFGLGLGLVAALMIAFGAPLLALVPLLASRLADGLDGAVARATRKTDFGGYLDIAADFLFYAMIPLAFVLADPVANGAAGAFLLASFYFNGTSFLGFAILAEKHGHKTDAQGQKSLYYSNGILEGTETIMFFVLLCLFETYFAPLAWIFGTLCFLTAVLRIYAACRIYN